VRRLATAIAAVALLAGAAAEAQPRPAGLRPAPDTTEGGLWAASEKAELEAKRSGDLNKDPALNAYVQGLACKLAAEYCGELRVYIMDRPFMNASMAPNGYMEVWSGTLLRVQTEDQLAYVIGHEIGHFADNHSIEAWQATKNRLAGGMLLQAGVALVGVGAAVNAGTASGAQSAMDIAGAVSDLVYLGTIASVFGFSRENEEEADRLGYERASKAGYAANDAPLLWRNLRAETAASEFRKVRNREAGLSIFNTHPVSAERVKALDTLAAGSARATGAEDRRKYRAVIRPHLLPWFKAELRRRDYGQVLLLAERLAQDGEDLGVLNHVRGEAYRQRRKDGDAAKAMAAYAAAVAQADAPADSWRALGDLQSKAGDRAAARTSYQTYLIRAPEAQDRWLIEASLKTLESSQ
jgi:predicted Zn-dependent protease